MKTKKQITMNISTKTLTIRLALCSGLKINRGEFRKDPKVLCPFSHDKL